MTTEQKPATDPEVLRAFDRAAAAATEAIAGEVVELVRMESPSYDVDGIDAVATRIAGGWEELGATVVRHRDPGTGTSLEIRWPGPPGTPQDAPPALVVGHLDTVHPAGALERNPVRRDGDRLHGPGTQDMKGGLTVVRHAARILAERGVGLPRPVTVLVTADEEVGSPSTRELIEELARASAHALVLEGAAADGSVKTERKGVGIFRLEVRGTAAHAGVHFDEGVNAAVGLGGLLPAVAGLSDATRGTTVNVGVVRAGTVVNVVCEHAVAEIDVRFSSDAEATRVADALRALRPEVGELTVHGGVNRPAMRRTDDTAALFARARAVEAAMGRELTETAVGGASDGNYTAAVGTPTLDGLGPLGAGLHTDREWVDVPSLAHRTALLAGLLATC